MSAEFEKGFAAAEGYFQLGMWNDSWSALEELAPEFRHIANVIVMRVQILNNLGKWEDASVIGEGALRHYPDNGDLYLTTAHAVRNCRGAAEAKAILMAGAPFLRTEAVFHFLLACYDCALGDVPAAKASLHAAIRLDESLSLKALDDPELVELWESI